LTLLTVITTFTSGLYYCLNPRNYINNILMQHNFNSMSQNRHQDCLLGEATYVNTNHTEYAQASKVYVNYASLIFFQLGSTVDKNGYLSILGLSSLLIKFRRTMNFKDFLMVKRNYKGFSQDELILPVYQLCYLNEHCLHLP